jgi:D-tagatose-1,6-bisphosphate aldolase subunit GatZ/KbaZ
VAAAVQALLRRLEQNPPPITLLSQYLPAQYGKVRQGSLENTPLDLLYDHIQETLAAYPAYPGSEK